MMLPGLLGSMPATYMRFRIPVSGGPTRPCADESPPMVWQDPQPKRPIALSPRFTSPPVHTEAIPCTLSEGFCEHPASNSMAMNNNARLIRITSPSQRQVAFAEPRRQQQQAHDE